MIDTYSNAKGLANLYMRADLSTPMKPLYQALHSLSVKELDKLCQILSVGLNSLTDDPLDKEEKILLLATEDAQEIRRAMEQLKRERL